MATKSTIVRLYSLAFRTVSAVSPGLAVRWLERLFLTPKRWSAPAREQAWLADASQAHVDMDDGTALPVWTWGTGPTVLLAHGWAGRGAQLGAFVAPLVADGFRVVTWDAPGHGAAPGRRSSLPAMAEAMLAVAAWAGPVEAVVAHSLGGAATTLALAQGLVVGRLVYIGSPENPGDYLYEVARTLGLNETIPRRVQRRVEDRLGVPWEHARGSVIAPFVRAPLLVVHDLDDREVSYAEGQRYAEVWGDAELLTTRGLGHRRILREPDIIAAATRFLASASSSPDLAPGWPKTARVHTQAARAELAA